MPITYTNRKGRTYYLCKGVTKTGKPRYYFAREPKGEPVEQIPEGYEISESVNAVVSLVKVRPSKILPEEVAAVEAAVQQHPRSHRYRVNVKHDRIEVYEQIGPDANELVSAFAEHGLVTPKAIEWIRDRQERRAQFTSVLHFILADPQERVFGVQRICYLGSIDDWIDIGASGPVTQLASQLVPRLGTNQFFELY